MTGKPILIRWDYLQKLKLPLLYDNLTLPNYGNLIGIADLDGLAIKC